MIKTGTGTPVPAFLKVISHAAMHSTAHQSPPMPQWRYLLSMSIADSLLKRQSASGQNLNDE
jgi:hypothetical protein